MGTPPPHPSWSPMGSRRAFLRGIAMPTAIGTCFARSLTAAGLPKADRSGTRADRANRAYQIREHAAARYRREPAATHQTNGDEERYLSRIGSYTKGLPHDPLGEVRGDAYAALVRALTTGDPEDFALIPLSGAAREVNPQSAFAFDLAGPDAHQPDLEKAPALASADAAAELGELYCQALTRDIPFARYDIDPDINRAAAHLSALPDFRGPRAGTRVTPATIFRGTTAGDLAGPYISQFLYQPVPYGPYTIAQRVRIAAPSADYLTEYADWLAAQNGAGGGPMSFLPGTRYIVCARDLTEYVHRDFSFQAFLNAALILASAPLARSNPYRRPDLRNQEPFTTFGQPHVLDLMSHAANLALRAAWCQKWIVHRRLRPEAMGGLVHHTRTGRVGYPIHASLLASPILELVISRRRTYLLPTAYPEGSPTHPSYPAGHATIAGACVTVLKAFYDEYAPIPNPVVPDASGQTLVPYKGVTLTIGGELDKLASNIAFGRNAAGIHFRSDAWGGFALGEAVALGMLRDVKDCVTEPFDGFSLTGFNGRVVRV